MSYPFEDLHEDQFERLVVECARYLFGAGVQEFAKGPDGGRDARFHGVAERFPSTAGPWKGITVIQAKHTNALNAHFAEGSFSGAKKSSVLSEEIGRIKALVDANECDNYLLVSNRRLGGRTAPLIMQRISSGSGLAMDKISLIGVERLASLLREKREVVALAGITFPAGSLLVSSYEIAEIILAVGAGLADNQLATELGVTPRVSYSEKNRANYVSADFAQQLSDRYLSYTPAIDAFLADPMNADLKEHYDTAVEEFQFKVLAAFDEHKSFDRIFNLLVDALVRRDGILASNKKSLRALLFYMYWHCDIGKTVHVGA
ncbi:ABC-three component system protein [Microbacterium halotolerans]|uniref:ABC-three component system protein n=1 Tax=Microbacterium halotolerans TaxID=246613 RepID=UPI000E6AD98C|nr:ABC-three component system protein [Microbacterium halotolerans]